MIKRFLLNSILFFVVIVLSSSCSKVVQSMADNVEYKLVGIDINIRENSQNLIDAFFSGKLSDALKKAKVTPHMQLTNHNATTFEIYKTQYKVLVNREKIADGISNKKLVLKAGDEKNFSLPIEVELDKLAAKSLDILISQDIDKVKIIGKSYLDSIAGKFVVSFKIHNNKLKIDSVENVEGE